MKISILTCTFVAALAAAGCAVQPGAPEGNQGLPAVSDAPIQTEDYNQYAACMDRCTGGCDQTEDPGCTSLPDWGSETLDCHDQCATWLTRPGRGGGGVGKRPLPKER